MTLLVPNFPGKDHNEKKDTLTLLREGQDTGSASDLDSNERGHSKKAPCHSGFLHIKDGGAVEFVQPEL